MKRIVLGTLVLSSALAFTSMASAQHVTDGNFYINDVAIENLCLPEAFEEIVYEQPALYSGLSLQQLDQVRVELLERGYDPGFDPYRDNTIDAQLSDALAQFQEANELQVTGVTDIPTLEALSFPIQQLQDFSS